jgi:HlyD family secretion protein
MTMIALTRSIALGSVAMLGLGTGLAELSVFGDARAVPDPDPTTPAVLVASPAVRQEAVPGPDPTASISDGATTPHPEAIEVRSEVEEPIPVRSRLIEPGGHVRQGQTVVELDARALIDQLAIQQIATETADADYQNAIKAREIAEFNVRQFMRGTYPLEERVLFGEIEIAQADLDLARSRFDQMAGADATARIELDLGRSRPGFAPPPADGVEMPEKPDFASMPIQHQEARIQILRAELGLKKAEGALEVLETYTRDREVKALEAIVERSKSDELAKQSRFELEKEKEEKLRRMIEKCKLYAPSEGILRHPPGVFEGGTVKERQILFWIDRPDAEEHQVDEAEAEVEAGSKQSEIAAIGQQVRELLVELRTRFSRDEPLTEAERASYGLRYEHAREQLKAARGRPDLPGTDFETLLERLGQPGNPDR